MVAEPLHVAVAANFAPPMHQIAQQFEQDTGFQLRTTFGSTGKLTAQIQNGAPFALLLAADDTTCGKLEQTGLALSGSRRLYATGKLVLWSPQPDLVDAHGEVLKTGRFTHLALAAPKLAPYGTAAMETLQTMGLLETLRPRFVQGENIAQTYQFVLSGNAQLGFVALSQIHQAGNIQKGSAWIIPDGWYRPLRQEAVILHHGRTHPAALPFLEFLTGARVQRLIQDFGYIP
ncbi:MAG: molybdate ABC transporter substrate-binding protein [Magnetococcales bacterium]|nr:molybdate ABC transporter substrate-binding protein [Magnetococcales bacterium]